MSNRDDDADDTGSELATAPGIAAAMARVRAVAAGADTGAEAERVATGRLGGGRRVVEHQADADET